ncbi:flagellar hook basal-body protein [Candidatus Saganbacteria bacterium]|uniref:Flagellar hook basal-body protein n=1 Tax=Candidatus Saganbacteria bacterium TaxID=2575572 RepID=A0A9D6UKA8_UNCSA|nr:flagellar hook basal-body protein [Candidatus Saganbacteria bacterium]
MTTDHDRILQIGEAGLEATDQRVRKLMDNIVNSEVPGYKKSDAVVKAFPLELEAATQKISPMLPQVEGSFYSNIQGALVKTGGKLDLALAGDGYFVLAGPWGEGFTRDGRFRLDKDGRLLTVAGNYPVLGRDGPIVVTPGAEVEFSQEGEVRVDGVVVDRVRVVVPEQKSALENLSGSVFKKKAPFSVLQEIENPRVIQGYIEASNVDVIDQMMEMIVLERLYNLSSKVVATRDANLSRAMELGRATQ